MIRLARSLSRRFKRRAERPFLGSPRVRVLVGVIAGLTVTGGLIGCLWALIAPAIHGAVALTHSGHRAQDYLGNEPDHFFVGPFLILGLLCVVAMVAAVLVWQWRAHRGPGMVVGLTIGLTAAAGAAAAVGALVVRQRYGVVDLAKVPLTHDDPVAYFTQAPPVFFGHTPMQIAATLLLPGSLAALVYALMVAAAPRDDLGAHLEADSSQPPIEVTASSGSFGSP